MTGPTSPKTAVSALLAALLLAASAPAAAAEGGTPAPAGPQAAPVGEKLAEPPQHRLADKTIRGPVLILAGAGTGKTRVITFRIAHLIEWGISSGHILGVTFTNKAAREMLGRVESLTKLSIAQLWGGTFHHVANRILRGNAHLIGYDNTFTIIDRDDSRELIAACMADLGLSSKDRRFPQSAVVQDIISLSINTRSNLPDLLEERYPFFTDAADEITMIAIRYQKRKQKEMLMDFDDLLRNCLKQPEPPNAVQANSTREKAQALASGGPANQELRSASNYGGTYQKPTWETPGSGMGDGLHPL